MEVGDTITINKSLKTGRIIGKSTTKDNVNYIVRIMSEGNFVYTEKQLSKKPIQEKERTQWKLKTK